MFKAIVWTNLFREFLFFVDLIGGAGMLHHGWGICAVTAGTIFFSQRTILYPAV